eukprot:3599444-Rhodomonas_salina.3
MHSTNFATTVTATFSKFYRPPTTQSVWYPGIRVPGMNPVSYSYSKRGMPTAHYWYEIPSWAYWYGIPIKAEPMQIAKN